ncbi:small glutamine-rich tetratricopeptide repeat-containing protein alpha [Arachis ipaensis]|uniref:small glutamine-rich tetratricopeptide repeat-containing protein alpha n=1 Tax=Arachis ipaensis TaxID=130454 RepID=UPI0007AFAA57|nr:small glutamine-rich tetratricopeptide repeat-containing protein alpha [Arachis ipaensis]XP_025665621.1 small glutamine-rich tetratricopeptide repeat-containing protein alpha isoform X1 [Arachis hypogaea]QHN92785.1 Small glutamine-rich tetratricopeptide repeat-containing protein alpha [Arachis hypogaea]
MSHNNHITTDSPLSRRIVRSFLQFLNSVEPGPGVDAEGIEVARECLAEAFKLNCAGVDGDPQSDSLIDMFKSLEARKQRETIKSDPSPMDASSSFSDHNPSSFAQNHMKDQDWTQGTDIFAASKDELCGKFFASLEKNHYFRVNHDGTDDPMQLEKASCLFDNAFKEMEKSGSPVLNLKNLAESLKSLGNKAMQSKQYHDAIELYNCAIAVHEKSAVYYCNRAAAYTQLKKYDEAIQDCLRSIEIDPNYSKAYSRLGLVYYAQGNYSFAIDKGFRKALLLDPNNEAVKENIRVAEHKLREEQHHANHNQSSRSSWEFPNQSTRGSRSHGVPPFPSVPFNPNDIASMFRDMAANVTGSHHGSQSQERPVDANATSANEPEIRIGGNINLNFDEMSDDVTGAFRSMMEMFSGSSSQGQRQDHMNGRAAPN